MTGRFVLVLIGAVVAAYLAGSSWLWFGVILAGFIVLGVRWDRVQMRKHQRRMSHIEPTRARQR